MTTELLDSLETPVEVESFTKHGTSAVFILIRTDHLDEGAPLTDVTIPDSSLELRLQTSRVPPIKFQLFRVNQRLPLVMGANAVHHLSLQYAEGP